MHLQQEPLAAAKELCERVLVRAETLRIGVCQAGVQYRHFFAWLLRTARRLNDDNRQAATEAAAIKVDPSNVAAFLQGQFCADVIGPEIKVNLQNRSVLAWKPLKANTCTQLLCSYVLHLSHCFFATITAYQVHGPSTATWPVQQMLLSKLRDWCHSSCNVHTLVLSTSARC